MDERTVARFWAKVDRRGPDECWPWTAGRHSLGYGRFWSPPHQLKAHRIAYQLLVGPIPVGLTLDHECHNGDLSCKGGPTCLHRRCVNPAHLVPKTIRENSLASHVNSPTHCRRGHEFTAANTKTIAHPEGTRRTCRQCHLDRARRYYYARTRGEQP